MLRLWHRLESINPLCCVIVEKRNIFICSNITKSYKRIRTPQRITDTEVFNFFFKRGTHGTGYYLNLPIFIKFLHLHFCIKHKKSSHE